MISDEIYRQQFCPACRIAALKGPQEHVKEMINTYDLRRNSIENIGEGMYRIEKYLK